MISTFFATSSALGAVPVVFVSLAAVVTLLCVRAVSSVMRVTLTRAVTRMLDASIVVLFVLFFVLVIVRFRTIG